MMQKVIHTKKGSKPTRQEPKPTKQAKSLIRVAPKGQTMVYQWNVDAFNGGYRYIVNQGGTSSGKTRALAELLLSICTTYPNTVVFVFGQTIDFLKDDVFEIMLSLCDHIQARVEKILVGNRLEIGFKNGSKIRLKHLKEQGKAKAGKCDISYINEVNHLPYEAVQQIILRTKKTVFFDYNPSEEFFLHKLYYGKNNCKFIISNYKHNIDIKTGKSHLTKETINEIESLQEIDSELWKSYGLGKTAKIKEVIFTNVIEVSKMPTQDEIFEKVYGLDFGFSPDPVAIVEIIRTKTNQFYFKEICYKNGIFNKDIFQILKSSGYNNELIIADAAEPKSIAELKRMGLNITKCEKFDGSVNYSIKQIQAVLGAKPFHIFAQSINLIKEIKGYKNKKKDGVILAEVDKSCTKHAIDAIRYGFEVFYKQKTVWIRK